MNIGRLRKHVNPATVMALAALVLAASGGAYAASGGGGSSPGARSSAFAGQAAASKGSTKKKASLRGPRGARGPAGATGLAGPAGPAGGVGPAGPAGAAGSKGDNGANGANGASGANGKSVVVGNAGPSECEEGGVTIEVEGSGVKHPVCNGEAATGGGFPATLPKGQSETGVWSSVEATQNEREESSELQTLSFSIPLAQPIANGHAVFVTSAEQTGKSGTNFGHCGGAVDEPKAKEGFLCIYQGHTVTREHEVPSEYLVNSIGKPSEALSGASSSASTAGAVFNIHYEGPPKEHEMAGSWAVTAE